jgi:hypothetical protein
VLRADAQGDVVAEDMTRADGLRARVIVAK